MRALNNKEQAGDFSDIVEGETRYGKAGQIAVQQHLHFLVELLEGH